MTIEAVAIKMLDIYFSNFLVASGWVTALLIGLKVVERQIKKNEAEEDAKLSKRLRRVNPTSLDE